MNLKSENIMSMVVSWATKLVNVLLRLLFTES